MIQRNIRVLYLTNTVAQLKRNVSSGPADPDATIASMLKATSDGADVVSMSLGSLNPDEADDPFKDITASLNSQGIAVIVAAGNEGDLGRCSSLSLSFLTLTCSQVLSRPQLQLWEQLCSLLALLTIPFI